MSAHTSPSQTQQTAQTATSPADSCTDDDTEASSPDEKLVRLKSYLLDLTSDGEEYIKGKFIADDVDLSSKEIGQLLLRLQDDCQDLVVEKWSYTNATTWRIAQADTADVERAAPA